LGRFLIFAGIALIVAGVIFIGAERLGIRLGSLPGDIRVHGRRGTFYFPVVTCLIVSVVLTLISWLFRR
jgi:hypothetical protein